jgi:hypothetical protein
VTSVREYMGIWPGDRSQAVPARHRRRPVAGGTLELGQVGRHCQPQLISKRIEMTAHARVLNRGRSRPSRVNVQPHGLPRTG